MEKTEYFNDLMARMEALFYHELSDCASWKTEFIGVDFIQAKTITGDTPEQVIESCIREIASAGLIREASYSIGGEAILLYLKVRGCIHLEKEIKLQNGGIKPYNCPIVNMILDQLIERLNFATTYVADLEIDAAAGECTIKSAVFEKAENIGNVCDWSDECRLIDENNQWKIVSC